MSKDNRDITKLTKWMQNEISRLKNNNELLANKLKEYQGKKETNVHIVEYPNYIPLPKKSEISFSFGEGWGGKITCKIIGKSLEVFGDDIQVMPRASNHVHLKLGKL